MKSFYPLALLVVVSCGGNDSAFRTPDHVALSPVDVPLYRTTADAITGDSFTALPMRTPVYVTDDTFTSNDKVFERVLVGDSSAYVPAGLLLRRASVAVLLSDYQFHSIPSYGDAALSNQQGQYAHWQLAIVGPLEGNARAVMTSDKDGVWLNYVNNEFVATDELNLEFYKEHEEATQSMDSEKLNALVGNEKYAGLKAHQWFVETYNTQKSYGDVDERGDAETGEDEDFNETDYGDPGGYDENGNSTEYTSEEYAAFIEESGWMNEFSGVPLEESEVPGTIGKFIISNLAKEYPAEGLTISRGMVQGENPPALADGEWILSLRIEVRAKIPGILSFDRHTGIAADAYTVDPIVSFDAKPGEPYFITVGIDCEPIRVAISANRARAVSTLGVQCNE